MGRPLRTEIPLIPPVKERAVRFDGSRGKLAGNLICAGSRTGVLFLHGWGGHRSGPHNLLTTMARDLAARGISSLRFDFYGRGESEGDGVSTTLDDMGDDALAAASLLLEDGGVSDIVVVGICSGGNVGIGVLDRLPEAHGLFLMSVYPFSDGDSFGRSARRTAHYAGEYWRKVFMPQTWSKLFRGAIDFKQISRILFGHYRKKPDETDKEEGETQASPLKNVAQIDIPFMMTYGDADPDFQASYDYYRAFAEENDVQIDFQIYPGANHNFYSLSWKRQLVSEMSQFVEEINN
jgi:pimeloyl-ACP methyl ester carboxylesterase